MKKDQLLPVSSGEEQAALARFASSIRTSIFYDLDPRFQSTVGNAFTTKDPERIAILHSNSMSSERIIVYISELEMYMPKFVARVRKEIAKLS